MDVHFRMASYMCHSFFTFKYFSFLNGQQVVDFFVWL